MLFRSLFFSQTFSKGFYSFYVFVLLVFVSLAIVQYFSLEGRDQSHSVKKHIEVQMKIYASNLLDFGKSCVRKHSISSCKNLNFDFDGYRAQFFISSCEGRICLIDLVLETQHMLDSNPIRYTQRLIWDMGNLQK